MILSLELIVNHLKARHEHSKEQSKIYSKGSIINEVGMIDIITILVYYEFKQIYFIFAESRVS